MRKFKRFPPPGLSFCQLLIFAGVLTLLPAFTPRANADLIAYFNFEGPATTGFPVNMTSHTPAFFDGSDLAHTSVLTTNYDPGAMGVITPGLTQNLVPSDPAPNNTAVDLVHSVQNSPGNFDIPLFSAQGFFSNMTISFGINVAGNGFQAVQVFVSTDGGANFLIAGPSASIPTGGATVIALAIPTAANGVIPLVIRLQFQGGQSNGTNRQDIIDNIQISGIIVPEPATVTGGLLGVLGLCWHQRRRLIRSVRLRPT
jgi:hypothetical protein